MGGVRTSVLYMRLVSNYSLGVEVRWRIVCDSLGERFHCTGSTINNTSSIAGPLVMKGEWNRGKYKCRGLDFVEIWLSNNFLILLFLKMETYTV